MVIVTLETMEALVLNIIDKITHSKVMFMVNKMLLQVHGILLGLDNLKINTGIILTNGKEAIKMTTIIT
jgi:hypothetical protein